MDKRLDPDSVVEEVGKLFWKLINNMTKRIPSRRPSTKDVQLLY